MPREIEEVIRMALKKTTKRALSPEQVVDVATEELMRVIDEHPLSGSDVPQSQTVDMLRALRSAIDMRIETIRQEMKQ